jgi:hypothetical protein
LNGGPDGFEFKQLTGWLPQCRFEKTAFICSATFALNRSSLEQICVK